MFGLFKGCAGLFVLITVAPMVAFVLTPRSWWLLVLLGLAALVVLGLLGALRCGGGVIMFLLGRASVRRR